MDCFAGRRTNSFCYSSRGGTETTRAALHPALMDVACFVEKEARHPLRSQSRMMSVSGGGNRLQCQDTRGRQPPVSLPLPPSLGISNTQTQILVKHTHTSCAASRLFGRLL